MAGNTKEESIEKKTRKNILLLAAIITLAFCGLYYLKTNISLSQTQPGSSIDPNELVDQSIELTSRKWTWKEPKMKPDITTTPSQADAFTATFGTDGILILTTDCNSGNTTYETGENNSLSISPIASTMIFCEGSAETVYFKQIQTAKSYKIENGQLNIMLQGDTGTMIFQ